MDNIFVGIDVSKDRLDVAVRPTGEAFVVERNAAQRASIGWPEPFGLVMVEAMACGTPVIAFPCGSVPEVVTPGRSGFIVHTLEEAVEALDRAGTLDRRTVREVFEKRFTVERMAQDYLAIYRDLPGVRSEAARVRGVDGDKRGLDAVALRS